MDTFVVRVYRHLDQEQDHELLGTVESVEQRHMTTFTTKTELTDIVCAAPAVEKPALPGPAARSRKRRHDD